MKKEINFEFRTFLQKEGLNIPPSEDKFVVALPIELYKFVRECNGIKVNEEDFTPKLESDEVIMHVTPELLNDLLNNWLKLFVSFIENINSFQDNVVKRATYEP
jgi:hypothetical protein